MSRHPNSFCGIGLMSLLEHSSCGCPAPQSLAGDSSLGKSSSGDSYVEAPVENKEVSLHSCCADDNINRMTAGDSSAIIISGTHRRCRFNEAVSSLLS